MTSHTPWADPMMSLHSWQRHVRVGPVLWLG